MLGSRNLLDLFLIEKAACEIAYEAAHRPTSIGVLIAGLADSSVGLTVRETGAGWLIIRISKRNGCTQLPIS